MVALEGLQFLRQHDDHLIVVVHEALDVAEIALHQVRALHNAVVQCVVLNGVDVLYDI